jgi:zinc/manganese transport system substrate-binding protein
MQPANGTGRNKLIMPAAIVVIIILVAVAAGIYLSKGSSTTTITQTVSNGGSSSAAGGSNTVIPIVAAENFWGSLVSQLAGVHGNVTSIVSDPNTDPHEYQSNPANAKAIADAKLVVINGMNYDTWAQLILNASNTPGQIVINVQHVVGIPSPDQQQTINGVTSTINPHLWYSPFYVNDSVHAFYNALVKIDPTDTSYFNSNYASLNSSLYHDYMQAEEQIKAQFGGTPYGDGTSKNGTSVLATESIFIFMANATGLNVLSPQGFLKAIAEGDDPTPADIATMQNLEAQGNGTVHCLIYNVQTVTPVTQQLKAEAAQYEIPITQVSETIQPPNLPFQNWMQGEVANLQNCLNAAALGQ